MENENRRREVVLLTQADRYANERPLPLPLPPLPMDRPRPRTQSVRLEFTIYIHQRQCHTQWSGKVCSRQLDSLGENSARQNLWNKTQTQQSVNRCHSKSISTRLAISKTCI